MKLTPGHKNARRERSAAIDEDADLLMDANRAIEGFRNAMDNARRIGDEAATLLYGLTIERHWLVPPMHRPSCPLTNKPCTSWTCLVDVCVDESEQGQDKRGSELSE